MANSEPAPRHEIRQHTKPFYLHPTGMTLKLPYILKWSCSELGLPPHPLQLDHPLVTSSYVHKHICAICCGNKTIYKEVGWSAEDSSLLLWHKEEMPEDTVWGCHHNHGFLYSWVFSTWLVKQSVSFYMFFIHWYLTHPMGTFIKSFKAKCSVQPQGDPLLLYSILMHASWIF